MHIFIHFLHTLALFFIYENIGLEKLASDKHSGLLGPFLHIEENEVLFSGQYSQHFIFFVTYEQPQ